MTSNAYPPLALRSAALADRAVKGDPVRPLKTTGTHHIADMGGRVKRQAGLAQAEARLAQTVCASDCALCARPLGRRIEWHHVVPKSEGGRDTVPVHPICHRTIHAYVSNRDLATSFADLEALRARDDVARFLRWIADKPADFHAPTRRAHPA